MATVKKVLGFYEEILSAVGGIVDKEGNVSQHSLMDVNEVQPVMVDGKRLVIPTNAQLSIPDWGQRVAFHPLVENIMHDEPPVTAKLRFMINQRLQGVLSVSILTLLGLACSPAEHKKLNPEQSEFLSAFKDADEKMIDTFGKILKAMPVGSITHTFVTIYLKKGGIVEGKKFSRAAIVSFPFYEELLLNKKDVFGVPLRNKDRDTFKKILEFVFPNITVKDGYNQGTMSKVAPFLVALLSAAAKLMDELNTVNSLFGEVEGLSSFVFKSDWVDTLNDVELLTPAIRMIPMLPGNYVTEEVATPSVPKVPVPPPVVQQAPVVSAPVAQAPMPMQPPPVMAPAPMAPVYQPQQPQPFGWPQQQVQQPQNNLPRLADGSVDVNALMMANRGGFQQAQQFRQQQQQWPGIQQNAFGSVMPNMMGTGRI